MADLLNDLKEHVENITDGQGDVVTEIKEAVEDMAEKTGLGDTLKDITNNPMKAINDLKDKFIDKE